MPDLIRIIDVWQKIGYIPALLALYALENGATKEEILETI
jgi:hypothetical protein